MSRILLSEFASDRLQVLVAEYDKNFSELGGGKSISVLGRRYALLSEIVGLLTNEKRNGEWCFAFVRAPISNRSACAEWKRRALAAEEKLANITERALGW